MTQEEKCNYTQHGISGAVLKWIAVITMLIDHFGAAVFVIYTSYYRADNKEVFAHADFIYKVIRGIGRTAFPIFCFLLVEGFFHTKHMARYIGRIFIFCILSEIPFDLALHNAKWDFSAQNVYWTLFFGLMAAVTLDFLKKFFLRRSGQDKKGVLSKPFWRKMILAAVIFFYMLAAYLMHTDYDANGVALILLFYILSQEKVMKLVVGYLSMIWEHWCFPAFILMYFYNGERGKQPKYFFYLFYPCHLFLLYLLRLWLLERGFFLS